MAMREQNKKEASLYSKMFKFPAKASTAAPAAEGGHADEVPQVVSDEAAAAQPAEATEATAETAPAAAELTVVPSEAEAPVAEAAAV